MINKNENTKYFKIAHVHIIMTANDRDMSTKFTEWLKMYEVENDKSFSSPIKLSIISLDKNQPIPFIIGDEFSKTFTSNNAEYFTYKNLWIVKFKDAGMAILNRETYEIIEYSYNDVVFESVWNFEDFFHPLFELIRQKKLYPHHSATTSYNNKGLLMPGKSGQGKTTLSLDLLSNGFDFLSDDRCFLREILSEESEQSEGIFPSEESKQTEKYNHSGENHLSEKNTIIEMFGFYEPLRVFSSNVKHIDTLKEFTEKSTDSSVKYELDIKEIYEDKILEKCILAGILFPQWSPGSPSQLVPMSETEALVELLPLSMVCFDAASTREHFEFSAKLVKKYPSAKLFMGDDKDEWHKLVMDFIKGDING